MPNPSVGGGKKRWTSRVRTGCLTCRQRRIKCDEAHPVCKKCTTSKRSCQYVLRWQPLEDVAQDPRGLTTLVPPSEATPPQWDFMQAVRYYYVVVWPAAQANSVKEIKPLTFRTTESRFPGTFICRVICDVIAAASTSRGRLLRRGEEPAFANLWANHARYSLEHLRHLNSAIKRGDKLATMYDMLAIINFDVMVDGFMWQAHMNGCFAFVEHCGGLDTFLDGPMASSLAGILMHSIQVNTTSPAKRQVMGYYHYTDHQLRTLLGDSISLIMPCPTELHIAVVHLTRLRVDAANDSCLPREATNRARTLFQDITKFDLDAWVESSEFSTKSMARRYGQVFHLAVELYGILSLPRSAVLAVYPDAFEDNGSRTRVRQRLTQRLRELYPMLEDTASIQWPFIVAGVGSAAGTDAAEDQQFVADCMYAIWRRPLTDTATYRCLEKLKEFWRSGETGWEDCFYEPTPS